ncbi:hypothetical protein CCM_02125 [Cordyceps militaris CM01]|uniref:DUF7907 domain-containing protein n=2 Tax=Cordyceps militaris TaxID=73501 RepID=G3J813_CORMM|nr:uncharacterized protein CCM_02125 [Cordyceps militaris CM01]ATY61150.1 hypothetical protein A9K55_006776 [Cordyceps militaris]EGX93855.1 hypothetical protein CCM_02125 [Cordyceps militaris CM01]
MKLTTIASAILLSGLAAADDIQSKPFKLVLDSSNGRINGKIISSCHSGAAIEGLCLSNDAPGPYTTYYLNTTEGATSPVTGYGASGKLVWNLPLQNQYVSEPMQFTYDPSTNVAHPLFQPSYTATYVAFGDEDNELALFSYVDDTVNPPRAGNFKALKQWYACTTYYTGYTYLTLNWVVGKGKPQNPTCVKTQVKRVFI